MQEAGISLGHSPDNKNTCFQREIHSFFLVSGKTEMESLGCAGGEDGSMACLPEAAKDTLTKPQPWGS